MKSFQDALGRKWDIVVNYSSVKRVRDALEIDITKLFDTEAGKVFNDIILLVDTLYCLCKEQCEARKISDTEFGEGLVGDSLEQATEALMEAVIDFFPESRRLVLRQTKAKSEELANEMTTKAVEAIKGLTLIGLTSALNAREQSA